MVPATHGASALVANETARGGPRVRAPIASPCATGVGCRSLGADLPGGLPVSALAVAKVRRPVELSPKRGDELSTGVAGWRAGGRSQAAAKAWRWSFMRRLEA